MTMISLMLVNLSILLIIGSSNEFGLTTVTLYRNNGIINW